MTIPIWAVPTILTIAIWGWLYTRASTKSSGDYGHIGEGLVFAIRGLACVAATLAIWLVYFIGLATRS